jgi:hypothetical protein
MSRGWDRDAEFGGDLLVSEAGLSHFHGLCRVLKGQYSHGRPSLWSTRADMIATRELGRYLDTLRLGGSRVRSLKCE